MGVFDKVKDSISGSDSGGKSDFDGNKYDSSFTDDSPGKEPSGPQSGNELQDLGIDEPSPSPQDQGPPGNDMNQGSPPGNKQNMGQQGGPANMEQNKPAPDRGSQGPQNPASGNPSDLNASYGENNSPSRGSRDSPNPQTGRPREGSSQPQVSRETQEKMERHGFNMNDNRGSGRNSERRQQPVSERMDDLEEIKSQNEQIIELLKRINDSLSGNSRGNSGSQRHGGRL